jgi:hypothetical protein
VDKEVKIVKTKIQIRTTELDMGTKPLIVIHVKIIETIVKEIDV